MDAATELGRNPVTKQHIQPEYVEISRLTRDGTANPCREAKCSGANADRELYVEMSRLTRDGTAKPVSQGQILLRKRGQGGIYFPVSADHEQD